MTGWTVAVAVFLDVIFLATRAARWSFLRSFGSRSGLIACWTIALLLGDVVAAALLCTIRLRKRTTMRLGACGSRWGW